MESLKQKLADTQKALDELQAEYQEFAYVVSHDFSAPFRQIEGFAKMISQRNEDGFDEKTKKQFEFITQGTEKCQRLIESLLEYSRLNTLSELFEDIDCNEIMSDVTSRLARKIKESNAKINYSNLPQIMGDYRQISTLFYHLIDNSIKFQTGDSTPIIHIDAKDKDTNWQFEIKDNGIGIDAKHFNKVFVILRRAVREIDYAGEGMGLALARKIIQSHNGKIWISEDTEDGTSICFTIAK